MSDPADAKGLLETERQAGRRDACSGILIVVAGLAAIALSLRLPAGSLANPAAGTFPLILSVVLLLLGVALTIQQFNAGLDWAIVREAAADYGKPLGVFVVLTSLYILAFDPVGFLVSTGVYLAFMLWYFQGVSVPSSTAYAFLLSAGSYFLFNHYFKLGLPGLFAGLG